MKLVPLNLSIVSIEYLHRFWRYDGSHAVAQLQPQGIHLFRGHFHAQIEVPTQAHPDLGTPQLHAGYGSFKAVDNPVPIV